MFVGSAVVAAALAVGVTVWPFVTKNQLSTPKGGANQTTASDTMDTRGAPAQRAAESTGGKNDPTGCEWCACEGYKTKFPGAAA
jgi:hypothetical protein